MASLMNSIKYFKGEIPILHKLLHKTEEECTFCNSIYKASFFDIKTSHENYTPMSLINIDTISLQNISKLNLATDKKRPIYTPRPSNIYPRKAMVV